jgi:hypothetical protein
MGLHRTVEPRRTLTRAVMSLVVLQRTDSTWCRRRRAAQLWQQRAPPNPASSLQSRQTYATTRTRAPSGRLDLAFRSLDPVRMIAFQVRACADRPVVAPFIAFDGSLLIGVTVLDSSCSS